MPLDEDLKSDLLVGENNEDTQQGKYLTFNLGKEEYGIEIRHVTEIIGIQNITELPNVPYFVKGVINLRGKVVPVIDIRLRFSFEEREYNERTSIIVVNINQLAVGIIVDTVTEVLDITEDNIEPPPNMNSGTSNRYIKAFGKVGSDVKILLDTEKLLFENEANQIAEMIET